MHCYFGSTSLGVELSLDERTSEAPRRGCRESMTARGNRPKIAERLKKEHDRLMPRLLDDTWSPLGFPRLGTYLTVQAARRARRFIRRTRVKLARKAGRDSTCRRAVSVGILREVPGRTFRLPRICRRVDSYAWHWMSTQ